MTIACIGSGNMGCALMKSAAKIAGCENTGFADAVLSRAEAAAKALGGRVYASNTEAVLRGDFVFLAVKPQTLETVLAEIAAAAKERAGSERPAVLVSMAAGWPVAKIQAVLSRGGTARKPVPVARIMPNTPALVSRGVIALTVPPEAGEDRGRELERILGAAGLVDRLEEKYLDAVTALSGSGPAFVYLFIEALADGGVRAGLPRDKALRYAAQTVLGSAAMVTETGKHPGELKDMVTSPAGTTIAGIAALENGAFRGAVMNAVDAAYRRSREIG